MTLQHCPVLELVNSKVDDDVIVAERSYSGFTELFMAKVIKRSPSRITVQHKLCVLTFTVDGQQFPRPKGYHPGSVILPSTPENIAKCQRSRVVRSIRGNIFMVNKFVNNRPDWSKFSQEQLDEFNKALYDFGKLMEAKNEDGKD